MYYLRRVLAILCAAVAVLCVWLAIDDDFFLFGVLFWGMLSGLLSAPRSGQEWDTYD